MFNNHLYIKFITVLIWVSAIIKSQFDSFKILMYFFAAETKSSYNISDSSGYTRRPSHSDSANPINPI